MTAVAMPQCPQAAHQNSPQLSYFSLGPRVALSLSASMDNEKTTDTESSSRELVVEILRYLVAHPKAKDTLHGILNWWLSGLGAKASSVEDSLEFLVAQGWLLVRSSPQSGRIYSLNEVAIDQIKAFLAETRQT